MRNLTILFTTEDEIFFVNEAKQLEFYREEGDGEGLFKELFGYSESFEYSGMLFCDFVKSFIKKHDKC